LLNTVFGGHQEQLMAVQPAPFEPRHLIPVEALDAPTHGRLVVGPWPELPAERSAGGIWLGLWQVVATAIGSWAYAKSDSRRDLRVDLLRGACVFAMLANHLGGESWLYLLTGGNQSYFSAAEGFIFISGLVVGQVYLTKIHRQGLSRALAQLLRRARTLYVATVVMTLMFSLLRVYTDVALWVPREVSSGDQSLLELIVSTVTLHHTYHGSDIPAMYVFCLVAGAAGLALLSFGRWRWLLAGSALVWLGYQFRPDEILVPWYIHNSENFPLAAWQLLFMTGLVIGFHRDRVADWLGTRPTARMALVAVALALTVAIAWSFHVFGATMPDLFDKVPLRPVRLVGFAAAAVLAYALTTVAWDPLRRATGWLLLPLGQHALYCYLVHLFLIVAVVNVRPGEALLDSGWFSPIALGTALQFGLVLAVWGLVRRRVLFGIVPN
jgi:hypothetical protein